MKSIWDSKKLNVLNQETADGTVVSAIHIGAIRELAVAKQLMRGCKVAAVDLTLCQ